MSTDNSTPFDDEPIEDMDFGGGVKSHAMTASEIEDASELNMRLGWHLVEVSRFVPGEKPKPVTKDVNVSGNPGDGNHASYTATQLAIELTNVLSPGQNTRIYVMFPPTARADDPPDVKVAKDQEYHAFVHGGIVKNGKISNQGKGFLARQFYNFIGAMFDYPPGATLPREACSTANWWKRRILILIGPPREGSVYNQVVPCKCRPIGPNGKAKDGGMAALMAARAELDENGGPLSLLRGGKAKPKVAPVASSLTPPPDGDEDDI
jgi:hypothetical protein